jgi:hypothetical protein
MANELKEKTAEITKRVRAESGMTAEVFALYLCERIPGISHSKQNISNWERAVQAVPEYFALLVFSAYPADDRRYRWGLECLRAIRPDLWNRVSEVA